MTGYREDIPGILAISDISVLVSDSAEGVPQIIVQSLAMRKPVVGTNVGGIPEIITDGFNGLLISPNSPKQLSEAIIRLATETELREKLKKEAIKSVQEYTWEKIASRYEDVYKIC